MKNKKIIIALMLLAMFGGRVVYKVNAQNNNSTNGVDCEDKMDVNISTDSSDNNDDTHTFGGVDPTTHDIYVTWPYYGTEVTIGDQSWIASEDDYQPPVDDSGNVNSNFGYQGDDHWDWLTHDEDGNIHVDVNNKEAQEYMKQVAEEAGVDLPDNLSGLNENSPEMKDILKYLAQNNGTDFTKGYEGAIRLSINGEKVWITVDDLKGEYAWLLDDPTVGGACKKLLNASCPDVGGRCNFKDEGEFCQGNDCDDDDDDENDDDDDDDDDNTPNDDDNDDDNTDDDNDDDITICVVNCEPGFSFEGTPESCDYVPPTLTPPPTPKVPDCPNNEKEATCESPTEIHTSCSTGTIACGYATTQTIVTTTVNYPGSPSNSNNLYAGHSFVWGTFSSSQSVSTKVVDTSAYEVEKANITAMISSYQSYISCLVAKNAINQRKISELVQQRDSKPGTCYSWYEKRDNEGNLIEAYWQEKEGCVAAANAKIKEFEDMIRENEGKIESANTMLSSLSGQLATVERCGAEISNYSGYSYTTPDVVKFSGATMTLSDGYVQEGNSIVAIMKNSGELLTEKIPGKSIDLPGGLIKDTAHNAQFVIPVTTKNNTTGKLTINTGAATSKYAGDAYAMDAEYPDVSSLDARVNYTKYQSVLSADTQAYDNFVAVIESNKRGTWINNFCSNSDYVNKFYEIYTGGNSDMSYKYYSCYSDVDRYIRSLAVEQIVYTDFASYLQKYNDPSKEVSTKVQINHQRFYNLFADEIKEIDMKPSNSTSSLGQMTSGKGGYQLTNSKQPLGGTTGSLSGLTMNQNEKFTETRTEGSYSCDITIKNPYICLDYGCGDGDGSLNLIYRQISLANPFPNANGGQRQMGKNWNPTIADYIITNNRGVKEDEVYDLTPLYTITLTPSTIKDIRNDYGNKSLTDFELSCDDNGRNCVSDFVHDYLYGKGAIE